MNSLDLKAHMEGFLPSVLSFLSHLTELPKTGLLAGGALANLLWASHTGRALNEVPVNDVDVFYLEAYSPDLSMDKVEPTFSAWHIIDTLPVIKTSTNSPDNVGNADANYIRHYIERHLCRYMKIERAQRDGLLNTVYYAANDNSPLLLIDSFDINATMVAYDLGTGILYYNSYFEHFLNTSELKVVNFHTPYHTVIRACEKAKQLGLSYDLDRDMSVYAQFSIGRISNARVRFGTKYRNLYYHHIATLQPFFKLEHVSYSINEVPIWTLRVSAPLQKQFRTRAIKNLYDVSDINYYAKNVREYPARLAVWEDAQPLWLQQGDAFIAGLSDVYLQSERVLDATTLFHSFLQINELLSVVFGRVCLSHLVQLMEWVRGEQEARVRYLFEVIDSGDFSDVHTKEDFDYYTSILVVAHRQGIARHEENLKYSRDSKDLPLDQVALPF